MYVCVTLFKSDNDLNARRLSSESTISDSAMSVVAIFFSHLDCRANLASGLVSGSFSSSSKMKSFASYDNFAPIADGNLTLSSFMRVYVSAFVLPMNGASPNNRLYRMTPILQMSHYDV